MHTLGPVSSSAAAQPCPRVEVASFLRLSPDQAEGVDEWESQQQKGTETLPELWMFLGSSLLCWRVPASVDVALPKLSSCVFHPSAELAPCRQLCKLVTFGCVSPPALPALSCAVAAQPAPVIVCGARLQPRSRPGSTPCCEVCFLTAAPTTHLGSARAPPLPPSLIRGGWD